MSRAIDLPVTSPASVWTRTKADRRKVKRAKAKRARRAQRRGR